MSWKVLVTALSMEKAGEHALALLQQAGCRTVLKPRLGFRGQALLDLLDGADAVLAGSDQYSAAVLQSPGAARLKIISRLGVGYDANDVPAPTALGIVLAYTPPLTDDARARYTFPL